MTELIYKIYNDTKYLKDRRKSILIVLSGAVEGAQGDSEIKTVKIKRPFGGLSPRFREHMLGWTNPLLGNVNYPFFKVLYKFSMNNVNVKLRPNALDMSRDIDWKKVESVCPELIVYVN